jgi:tetratricopeptide (TPR) repeat protein
MRPSVLLVAAAGVAGALAQPPAPPAADFKLSLPEHNGQLRWAANGFESVQTSARPNGHEMGIRTRDASGRLNSLGFLFLVPEDAPLTSEKCRDGALAQEKANSPGLKILSTSEIPRLGGLPVSLVTYSAPGRDGGTQFTVRGFIATADLCGDLEFYASEPISAADADLQAIFSTFRLDPAYTPGFEDVLYYAQILYQNEQYKPAAALLENVLALVPANGAPFPSAKIAKRVVTDQAAMSYGMIGDFAAARRILLDGIAADPDYPLYYYNLACADAGEKKLANALRHLHEAFARKANLNPDETMPDPAKDDSFLPYRADKAFWAAVEQFSRETGPGLKRR